MTEKDKKIKVLNPYNQPEGETAPMKIVVDTRAFLEHLGISEGIDWNNFKEEDFVVTVDEEFMKSWREEEGEEVPEGTALPRHLTFDEAKTGEDGVVIMEGDYGGQIYLSCQMKYVKCSEKELEELLWALDRIAWSCNEGDGRSLYYHRVKPGFGISGGMGGGIVVDGLWLHEEFVKISGPISKVISGKYGSLHEALGRHDS